MTTAQALQSILGSVAIILALVVQSWLGNRVSKQRHEETTTKVAEVQKLVNGAAEAITARNVQLETELVKNDVPIPPHVPPPPAPEPEAA